MWSISFVITQMNANEILALRASALSSSLARGSLYDGSLANGTLAGGFESFNCVAF